MSDEATSVYSADLDGDGDMDVLSSSRNDSKIAWYENNGLGEFGAQQVITTTVNGAAAVYSSDLDNDGDMDVLSASFLDDKIAWYANDGSGGFGVQQVITTLADWASSVYSADLDGDGDMDVLSASFEDDKIAWYENDGLGGFGLQQVITTLANGTESVYSGDIDGDGDMDVLSASKNDSEIEWYENDGTGEFGEQQIISSIALGTPSVHCTDIDGDGDLDVLSANQDDDKVAWYQNEGAGEFGEQLVITNMADGANTVFSADLDGDGDMDVLSASYFDNKIAWYENDGTGGFGDQHIISNMAISANSVYAIDLDGDGDIDVLSASQDDDKIAWYENLTGEGCTDPLACNYQPGAWIDNGTCCYSNCGCTVQGAENYNQSVTCDNGSCGFQVLGTVFFDENENGVMDGSEYGLPMQQLGFLPDSSQLTTNDNGQFFANASGSESYTFVLAQNSLFPYSTTPGILTFDAAEDNWNQGIFFGVSNEAPDFDLEANLYSTGNGYPCDVLRHHDICYRNTGNVPIDGLVELVFDTLFQGIEEVSAIDSIVDNKVYFSFEDLIPGQMTCLDIRLHTPTVDHIGEFLESSVSITGYYEGEQVASGSDSISEELTCAYDPNDKQVFPEGYSEAHYVPEEEYLEYLVRFQNTGNAPATDVIIRDTIAEGLDLSTFELIANSHSVFTTVKSASREVEFYFQDIQLPDSVNNEPESHGLISYRIRPEEGMPLLTEFNNTAYIFFDNNPPIVTNTTWSTLYNCSLFEVAFTQDGAILTAIEGDNYQWFFDGSPIEGATSQDLFVDEFGAYAVEVMNGFPCTGMSDFITVITGIDELADSPIGLFPNPMSTAAILDLGELRGEFLLEIYDVRGQLMRSETKNSEQGTLNLKRGSLASGQYLLRIVQTEGSFKLPFVVE